MPRCSPRLLALTIECRANDEFAVVIRDSEARNVEKNPSVEQLHGESTALGLREIVDRTGLSGELAGALCGGAER